MIFFDGAEAWWPRRGCRGRQAGFPLEPCFGKSTMRGLSALWPPPLYQVMGLPSFVGAKERDPRRGDACACPAVGRGEEEGH